MRHLSGVLMLQGRQAAKRAVERFPPPGISNGWLDIVSGGGRRGLRAATVKEGEVRYCYERVGAFLTEIPAAASPWRWMKAPRPAVIAVTNLLRFSA